MPRPHPPLHVISTEGGAFWRWPIHQMILIRWVAGGAHTPKDTHTLGAPFMHFYRMIGHSRECANRSSPLRYANHPTVTKHRPDQSV